MSENKFWAFKIVPHFSTLRLLDTIHQRTMFDLPCFKFTLVTSREEQVLFRIEAKRPDFSTVSYDCLHAMLGGQVP